MKAVMYRLMNLRARQKVFIALLSVVTSLALIVTGVGAWIQFTGDAFGWWTSRAELVGFDKGDPEAKPVEGEADAPESELAKNPFDAFGDNGKFTNDNDYPLIVRISVTEFERRTKNFYSENPDEPNVRRCLLGELPGGTGWQGWKTVEPENIIWAASGEMPEGFMLFYRATASSFEFVPCYYRYDSFYVNGIPQEVKCDRITYYSTDASTVFSATIHDAQYRYWVPSLFKEYDYVYLQWADGLAARMNLADPEKYVTSIPTNAELFKYWTPEGRDVALQLDFRCYRYPALARTLTKGQWFYNENDGYFYYVGILGKNQSVYPLGVDEQTMDWLDFTGIEIKSIADDAFWSGHEARFYAESIEANRDAAAALWGLTFEPGSLGAAIFGG